jgi:glutamate synthase domain-containing protein 3
MASPEDKDVSTAFSTRDINRNLRTVAESSNSIEIGKLNGHHNVAVGLTGSIKIKVDGDAGDYFGALNDGPMIVLNGKAGRFLGDSMRGGEVLVNGDVDHGLAVYLMGGTVVTKGDCLGGVGHGMRGGTVIVDGSVKGDAGRRMDGGTIVVTGHVQGTVGPASTGGRIFVGGDADKPARGLEMKPITPKEYEELKELNKRFKFKYFQTPEALKRFKRALPISGAPGERTGKEGA